MSPVTISVIVGLAGIASFVAALLAGFFNAGRQAQKFQELGDALRQDVNGLGKKNARMVAFNLRCIAEEMPEAAVKAKLLHLANLLEPK